MTRVEYVPVRHRRLGTFVAPDPRHGVAAAEWNLESYRLLPRGTKIVRAGANFLARTEHGERLAIKSEEDGEPRFLPDAFTILLRNGEVPAIALPELLHVLGPDLGRRPRDFEPVLARSRAWRTAALVGLALLGLLALAGAALFVQPVREALRGSGAGRRVEMLRVNGPGWLAAPMRADTFLTAPDSTPALATAELPAGYWPPLDRFNPPPLPGNDLNAPGFTLARVAALNGGEQRLVLCSSYERSLLPRVLLRGEVVPAADLALPADALARIGRGAPNLNAALVLCQNVSRRREAAAVDRLFVAVVGCILGTILVLPLTVVALLVWRRQAVRRQQLRALRVRLGLPEPSATPAGVSPHA